MERLELSVLGVPHLRHQGRLLSLGNRKTMALVVYLAVEGGMHARDKLAGMLWPEAESENARMAVRKALVRLRDLLPAGGLDHLEPSRNSVGIKGQGWLVDGLELRNASIAINQQRFTLEQLQAGLSAYHGDFLEGFELFDAPEFNEWAEGWRATTRGWMRQALETTCREALEAKRLDVLESSAERWIQFDSLDELAYRHLIVAHLRQGNRSAAQATLEQLRRALVELDGEPDAETLELFRAAPTTTRRSPPLEIFAAPALTPTVLVGRGRACETLLLAVEDRTPIVVRGEPGVGKTSLIQQTFSDISPSAYLQGRPGDAAKPFATLVRHLNASANRNAVEKTLHGLEESNATALKGLLQDKLEVRLGELAKPLLTSGLRQVLLTLNKAEQAETIVLDDLQFMDASSRELLLEIYPFTRHQDAGAVIVFAYRTGELESHLELQIQEAIAQKYLRLLELQPLAVNDLHQWLTRLEHPMSGDPQTLANQLHRATAGNPLFVLEALRNLNERATDELNGTSPLPTRDQHQRPERLSRLIQGRLERLGHEAQDLAHLMAVASGDFSLELAARVLGRTPLSLSKAMLELERAQLVDNAAFTHDLVFESVLSEMSSAVNTWLHHQIALHLPESLEAAEHHWNSRSLWNPQERSRACRCLVIAGKTLAVRGDLEGCLTWFDRARSIGASETERVTASLERIKALVRLDRFADAEAEMDKVEAELEWVSDLVVLGDGLTTRASMLLRERFEPSRAKGLLERALKSLEGIDSEAATAIRADALDYVGRLYDLTGNPSASENSYRRSAEESRGLNDPVRLARAWTGLADARSAQQADDAGLIYKQAMDLRKQTGDAIGQVVTSNNLAIWHLNRGEFRAAKSLLEKLQNEFPVSCTRYEHALIQNTLGSACFYLEEYWMARRYFSQAFERIQTFDSTHVLAVEISFNLAEANCYLGDFESMGQSLNQTVELLRAQGREHPQLSAAMLVLWAEFAFATHDVFNAVGYFQQAAAQFQNLNSEVNSLLAQARLAFVTADELLAKTVHDRAVITEVQPVLVQALLALGWAQQNAIPLHRALEFTTSKHARVQVLEALEKLEPGLGHGAHGKQLQVEFNMDSGNRSDDL